ncbi:MAG: C1 family peptidase [bacterium]|nr:C1 family peptidase [bacterium]
MLKRFCTAAVVALVVALLCGVPYVGCSTGGGGGGGGGGIVPPATGVTLGLSLPDPDVVAARPQTINPYGASAGSQLPSSADLTGELPPIGDQGQMGSCTAWATGYAGATYTANRQYGWGTTSTDHQASPGYLYSKLLVADNFNCGDGTMVATAMNLLIQEGCSSLQTVPYRDDQCAADPSKADVTNFRIGSFNRVVPTDRNAMRGELAAGRIVAFGGYIYDDFIPFTGSEVYRGSGVRLTQNNQHAGHAMAVVGYDDARGAYRVMNSWNTTWGDQGFVWMAYETFEDTAVETYSIEPASDREPPEPEPGPGPDPEPEGDPEGQIVDAFQFADVDTETGEDVVYLVFFYEFSAPVLIHTVTVADPSGNQAQQTYEAWYSDGYVYFVQSGGFQWEAGIYTLEFDTETSAGNSATYTGQAEIEPLDSGGEPAGEGICWDYCMFAYDGECDDGGSGSSYAVCDYGSDCFDCGPRDDAGDDEYGDDYYGDDEYGDDYYGDDEYGDDYYEDNEGGGNPKAIQRIFRGVPQVTPPALRNLPAAGVRIGVLGANRQPAVIVESGTD